jgi:light-regulated signal transduction histidine kinase (bacteriophytochrome)
MKKTVEKEDLIQKLVSDEARRLNAELERRCEDRVRESQELQAEMESFTYSVSHAMRAPLIHIGGFVDLLIEHAGSNLDEKGRHYLRTIAASTYRMGRMIDDLLLLTRVSRAEIHRVPLDLEPLVREVIDDLGQMAAGRKIEWFIDSLPTVEADPTLLRDALTQLLANAIKFTSTREHARINVTARRTEGDIVVAIEDNGVGFDMKYQDQLFGVFQRLHTNAEFDGSGIGLVRVRRILQRHGGRTWAEGVAGRGATFYLSLPDHGSRSPQ